MSQGPWGQRPSGPPGRGGRGSQPPDLEEVIRKSQERLDKIFRGGGRGGSGFGGNLWMVIALIVGLGWLYMSINVVEPDENGLVLRLGAYNRTTTPGLHFVLWPLEHMEKLSVEAENQINFGGKDTALTLAGDQNLVAIEFSVLWRIKDARDLLFNIADPEQLITRISESAMREIVGRTPSEEIRTRGRQVAQTQVKDLIQRTLDEYKSGILISGVQLEKADPPAPVLSSFEEVQRAEQNQNKLIREAEQYRNQILGQARGNASKVVEDAKAYKSRVVAEAQGEAQRFLSVLSEYEKAKDVTRQRLFLETLEDVLQKSNKVIIENGRQGQAIVPYLPLPEIQKRSNKSDSKTPQ
jgi:modulator of FtsH protease HflK